MKHETANALSETWTQIVAVQALAVSAIDGIVIAEDRDAYHKTVDESFIRNRLEGVIASAQKALELLPEGEE